MSDRLRYLITSVRRLWLRILGGSFNQVASMWDRVNFCTCVTQKLNVQGLLNPVQLGHLDTQILHKSRYASGADVLRLNSNSRHVNQPKNHYCGQVL